MEENKYSEKIERMNRRRNKFMRIVLLIIGTVAVCFTIQMFIKAWNYADTHTEHKVYDVYINGVYSGRHTHTSSDNGPYLVLAVLGTVISTVCFGIPIAAQGKDIRNYKELAEAKQQALQNGSFANATPRRRRLYYLAVWLGFLGADRFAAGCPLRGIFKLGLGFVSFVSIISMFEQFSDGLYIEDYISSGVFFFLLLLFWIRDAAALRKGIYKDRKGHYIQ